MDPLDLVKLQAGAFSGDIHLLFQLLLVFVYQQKDQNHLFHSKKQKHNFIMNIRLISKQNNNGH